MNMTDFYNTPGTITDKIKFVDSVSELTKNSVNQITLPIKRTVGKDNLWLNKTSKSLAWILDILNSKTENKWGIDRGIDKFILQELNKHKNEHNLPSTVTFGKGLIYV